MKRDFPRHCEKKSKVQIIRSNCDWGGILFNACYVFNLHLASHWLAFVDGHSDSLQSGIKSETENEINRLSEERKAVLERIRVEESKRINRSKALAEARSKYIHSSPIGDFVGSQRRYRRAQRESDLLGLLSSMQASGEYEKAIRTRNENYQKYVDSMDCDSFSESVEEEDQTVAYAHKLLIKINALKKTLDRIGVPFADSLKSARKKIYDMLVSEVFAEKLMGVCINILKTYSENDFFSRMTEYGREMTANYIYDSFSRFEHNYDFLCGIYEFGADGRLHLKTDEVLEKKIYNGYYMTIRGFVQRAYAHSRNEVILVSSIDEAEDGDERGMHEKIADGEMPCPGGSANSSLKNFDEGMVRYWKECRCFLEKKVSEMAYELNRRQVPVSQEAGLAFNNVDEAADFFRKLLKSLDRELSAGRFVRSKFRHLVLDAMCGAVNTKEWECQTRQTQEVIGKFLKQFFLNEMKVRGDEEKQNRFDFSNGEVK